MNAGIFEWPVKRSPRADRSRRFRGYHEAPAVSPSRRRPVTFGNFSRSKP